MVAEPHHLADLADDDRGGFGLPTSLGTNAHRLHRCRRGNISILVLVMGLVFFALAAMVWNTGKVTSAKIEAQTAADSAAYASAVWTSRAMNITTGTNMLILRHQTALTAAFSPLFVAIVPPFILIPTAISSCTTCFTTGVGCVTCTRATAELVLWGTFLVMWG
ncbi:MAG: pilus assembly protein TadG-related protein, partial [Planctomycetota bacterium]